MPPLATTTADSRARRTVLELLKRHGPQDAARLARRLRVTPMAVRQHLYALAAEKLVSYREERRAAGRPAKLWQLTPAADEIFPNAHAELTVSLIQAVSTAFGADGLDRLVAARTRDQTAAYRRRIQAGKPLRRKLEDLAAIRTREGYMAEVQESADGALLLVENHCPICLAATACTGLCAGELAVFKNVLGDGVSVERTDHIVAGARRCSYRVART